jgi:ABC-2 type transport system ATP-binding protein
MLLEAEKLGRWYGQVVGLNELTLSIEGGLTGLVGPNGAGKSTFLKLVAGELRPSRGSLRVLGEEPFANRDYLRRIGFCPQQDALYDDMTAPEVLTFLLRVSGFGAREARQRAGQALDRVGLFEGRERTTRTYSKGMRQRVRLAQAIAHDPEFVIADEPLTGLDPVGRMELSRLLAELGRQGVHVLVSSHVLHEVESITANIVLLHRGRLLAQGDLREVRALLDRHPRRVEIAAREPRRLAQRLMGFEDVLSVRIAPGEERLMVETHSLERFQTQFTAAAAAERAGVRTLESPDASLEAVFDYLVG